MKGWFIPSPVSRPRNASRTGTRTAAGAGRSWSCRVDPPPAARVSPGPSVCPLVYSACIANRNHNGQRRPRILLASVVCLFLWRPYRCVQPAFWTEALKDVGLEEVVIICRLAFRWLECCSRVVLAATSYFFTSTWVCGDKCIYAVVCTTFHCS